MLGIILIVVLILLLVGAFPRWPYYGAGYSYGYYPMGGIGLVLLIVLILVLLGHI